MPLKGFRMILRSLEAERTVRVRSAASTTPCFSQPSTSFSPEMRADYYGVVPLDAIRGLRGEILDVAATHGVRNVRIFGFVARGDDCADRDVDFLVDVEPGARC